MVVSVTFNFDLFIFLSSPFFSIFILFFPFLFEVPPGFHQKTVRVFTSIQNALGRGFSFFSFKKKYKLYYTFSSLKLYLIAQNLYSVTNWT